MTNSIFEILKSKEFIRAYILPQVEAQLPKDEKRDENIEALLSRADLTGELRGLLKEREREAQIVAYKLGVQHGMELAAGFVQWQITKSKEAQK